MLSGDTNIEVREVSTDTASQSTGEATAGQDLEPSGHVELEIIYDGAYVEDEEEWTYDAWIPHDSDDIIVVEEDTPHDIHEDIRQEAGVEEVIYPDEAGIEKVREPIAPATLSDEHPTCVYVDTPPEHRIEPINWRDAKKLVEHRYGLEIPDPRIAWYWPETNDAVVVYPTESDETGGDVSHIPVPSLSERERQIAKSMADANPDERDDEELRDELTKRAEDIYEHSPFSESESEVVAGREMSLKHQQIADLLNETVGAVTARMTRASRRWDDIQWAIEHIDDSVFEDGRQEGY